MHSTRTRHEVRPAWRARRVCVATHRCITLRACVRRKGQGRHVAGRAGGEKRPPAPSAPPTVPTPVLPSRRPPYFVKCSVCTAKTSIPLLERVVDIQMKCTLNPQNVHAPKILRVNELRFCLRIGDHGDQKSSTDSKLCVNIAGQALQSRIKDYGWTIDVPQGRDVDLGLQLPKIIGQVMKEDRTIERPGATLCSLGSWVE
ncbi:hypothetical protein EVAR_92178_1 [Eumeta japonica]|uniref:Uncharacterized protein n=1 Tax=Eumeta variegata TaxID=151549 RepID=A0A4C2A5X8_EUMVA|nr:hypothetical protein EVAR_92178_1 [Eumeta japonica]